ncbi:bifunctional adenosylcobinamide kinase/adenosylcobinamide-phosphate guanylyltransferase [Polynucleobacter sp.]|uniref:bifunctional adenosylcobinamide kinase/adenosylcobinamide-phosphate guanylyltransferase n=1 Tax=Polynucleobacter sp. TaxID=2029855 RepID=UPI00333FA814
MSSSEISRAHLILGGQKSGKSAHAELLTKEWLSQSNKRTAVLVATAQALDEEMHLKIKRHQNDRAQKIPTMLLIEEPTDLGRVIREQSSVNHLIVIDCLTIWLTNLLMPHSELVAAEFESTSAAIDDLLSAVKSARGPIIFVSNEIGMGVIPMGREIRQFVDELGILNQKIARICDEVTLMIAGVPLVIKGV